jgi:hypothetical protein
MKPILFSFSLCLLVFGLSSCTKESGTGGFASVSGVVWTQDWDNTFSIINSEFPAMDEDVYLMYGTDSIPSEDVKTSYNGWFSFPFLQPGKYTLYVYSNRYITPGNTNKLEPVLIPFEIKDKREKLVLDTIVIKR